jgi:hypothetical protein
MATSKQPPFPNPALEWGIPQYPTPNVPDFYTKDGHIILVEKVSAEKGSYNPQPLDGSVTYSKRDANKWPTDLYLVYQKPDETGQFVYNYYANDRTLASQDAWNFGLDYSSNNPAFPVTSRTYIVPRGQYETVALGSTDPVFGGNQIIAAQKKVELPDDSPLRSRYVGVQRVYETIPGPILSGKKLNDRGDIETITQQTVVAGTAPDADGLLVTQTAVQPVDSVKSTKTKGIVESYATLVSKANKSGLLGNVSVADDVVAPSTNPDALSLTVLDSSVEAVSATKSRKRTTTSTGPTSLSGGAKKAGLLGTTTEVQSIVSAGTSPDDLSTSVLQSEVSPIDAAKSKKTTITSTGPTSLVGASTKSGLLGNVSTTESIVAYGTAADAVSTTVLQSEVTPIDSAKSKKTTITSTGPTSLSGVQNKPGLLGVTSTTESIVAAGSSADELSISVLQSEVTPIDSAKSKKTTTSSTSPTALDGKTVGEFGLITTGESIVAYGSTLPTPTKSTVKLEKTPIDLSKSKLINSNYDSPQNLTGYQYDDFFQRNLTIEKSIIDSSTGALSITDGILSYKDEPIDPYKKQRIVVSTPSLPPSRTEYKTGTYTSPLLIFGLTVDYADFSSQCGAGADVRIKITPSSRSAQSNITTFKTITSYSYGSPTTPGDTDIFSPTLQEINYTGYVLSFNFGSALCDALTPSPITVHTCALPGPLFQYKYEQWNFPATPISASQYEGFIGEYKKVSWESKYWKAGIWEQKEVWVKLI